jgi:hypothetical protein
MTTKREAMMPLVPLALMGLAALLVALLFVLADLT